MGDTIMICTDLGKISSRVNNKGIELAKKTGAAIHYVHVFSGDKIPSHATPNQSDSVAKQRIQQQNKLQRIEDKLNDSGCPYEISTPSGDIIDELQKLIKKVKPYILVMGALNNTALRHVVTGSVAGTILNSTNCQVLLVPEEK